MKRFNGHVIVGSTITTFTKTREGRRTEDLLGKFQKEMEVVERDIRDSIDHDLNVKMRAATESLRINNKSALSITALRRFL